ncbi:uncharacterized protein LOC125029613 isoform X1 [Penaeus chinensis]|uniref:uncharacterized protein LOC125029613 isoform X1 n=1 Tax=Penaeus chinensis TaxID=139456 RepID=UPI001FB85185|nr:uncharacterized protein LOC125029613 isoform X1 [Penaeus chinensis]
MGLLSRESLVWGFGLTLLYAAVGVIGHGRLMYPPSRSSAWRLGFDTPENFNDNELFCGGFGIQYGQNDGKCGVCGDNWADPQPRDNEAGGLYGTGLITANFTKGQVITVEIDLTTSHIGHFEFRLCVNNAPDKIITDECLDEHLLQLADGSGPFFTVPDFNEAYFYIDMKLPDDVECFQCVLQWHYQTGNSWGDCGNGTSALGCGDQEVFRGCSDIGIYA